jgi:hypothetical protein
MINGAHLLLYSTDPDADQAVLRQVLGSRFVPAEPGRIIMALPPSEIATHDGPEAFAQSHAGYRLRGLVLYLMCDDLRSTIDALRTAGTRCTGIEEAEFGIKTTIVLPSGGEIGLYQPSHQTAAVR